MRIHDGLPRHQSAVRQADPVILTHGLDGALCQTFSDEDGAAAKEVGGGGDASDRLAGQFLAGSLAVGGDEFVRGRQQGLGCEAGPGQGLEAHRAEVVGVVNTFLESASMPNLHTDAIHLGPFAHKRNQTDRQETYGRLSDDVGRFHRAQKAANLIMRRDTVAK